MHFSKSVQDNFPLYGKNKALRPGGGWMSGAVEGVRRFSYWDWLSGSITNECVLLLTCLLLWLVAWCCHQTTVFFGCFSWAWLFRLLPNDDVVVCDVQCSTPGSASLNLHWVVVLTFLKTSLKLHMLVECRNICRSFSHLPASKSCWT